ncbi:PIG-L deacetylase family protein [Umezawaea tangerina]|uniref:LmbE family N-acetylglucosaminyl deacetylase n=1 Tax=Umezawaea tangerina TaxID=84725 RepID=A0A2T0SU68_9PSEU|nr:PIG-L family deacetylase [Umezawaea tangerina]PRY36954.1 LmbE family N-acetylglucosaminyl deacetylase [Umezawaea tangerina]
MQTYDTVLVISPHADDEVLGCGGMLARLSAEGSRVHVLYLSVDGMSHYGLANPVTYEARVAEIDRVAKLLGFEYTIAYGDRQLNERLDTLPRRELVDLFQDHLDRLRPDLLLLPSGDDYDQDHVATFTAAFAAARPIGRSFGKWLVPHVMSYEMSKLQWANKPLALCTAFLDISDHLDAKLAALREYASQHRPVPHIRSEESVSALAVLRGAEIGVRYAEAFEVHRTLL